MTLRILIGEFLGKIRSTWKAISSQDFPESKGNPPFPHLFSIGYSLWGLGCLTHPLYGIHTL